MQILHRLLIFTLVATGACAAEIKVPLVGLGWQIAFEAPPLKQSAYDYPAGAIQFRANSGRFNVSVFVEPPPKGAPESTHAACRDFYWSQGRRNPVIVADSIKQTTLANCEAVTYRSKGVFEGMPFVQDSVNCYFVHEGKWVDVHASVVTPTADDTKMLSEFATHLTHGPQQPSKGETEKFVLEGLGTAKFTPPAGWLTGNVIKDDMTFKGASLFTLSFFSPTDPNSTCLMTLSMPPKVPESQAALQQALENASKSAATQSVEGKAVIRDLKLKHGLGVVASFTDATLVGKPVEPGNAKAITSGMLVLKSSVFVVVTMFTDEANGPDAKKMLEALETLILD